MFSAAHSPFLLGQKERKMSNQSVINSKKKKTNYILVIGGLITFGVAVYTFSLIPAGGIMVIIGLVSFWIITIVGRLWPGAPKWMASVSDHVIVNSKRSFFWSLFFLLAGGFSIGHRASKLQQEERERIVTKQRAFEAKEKRRVEKIEKKKMAAEQQTKREMLLKNATLSTTKYQSEMKEVENLLDKNKIVEAEDKIEKLTNLFEDYRKLTTFPDEIEKLYGPFNILSRRVKRASEIRVIIRDLHDYQQEAKDLTKVSPDDSSHGWETIIKVCRLANEQITTLENVNKEFRRFIPKKLNLKKERRKNERRIKVAQRKLKKAQKIEAKAAAYRAYCGKEPSRSGWDGGYRVVENALKADALVPNSVDVENCTPAQLTKKNCWVTTCKVRNMNAFGVLVQRKLTFLISSSGVTLLG